MKLYLAGPMRGYAKYNFPHFLATAAELRIQGHEVLSPAEMDLEYFGPGCMDIPEGEATENFRWYMKRDLNAVLECDAVALLSGWQKSTGALIESYVGRAVGAKLLDAYTLEPIDLDEHAQAVARKMGLNAWMVVNA